MILFRKQGGSVFSKVRRQHEAHAALRSIYMVWLRCLDYPVDHVSVTEIVKGKKHQWNYYYAGSVEGGSFTVPKNYKPALEMRSPGVKHWIPTDELTWTYQAVLPMLYAWRKANVHHISVTVEDLELGELKWRFRYSK